MLLILSIILCYFMLLYNVERLTLWYEVTFNGYRKIKLYGNPNRKDFITIAKFDFLGNVINTVYKYHYSKIGKITLSSGGTAEYCGQWKWEII